MKTTAPEMRLRHGLQRAMEGRWLLTWHEDGAIGPGVPDASYVMNKIMTDPQANYETGWLELKARFWPGKSFTIKVEQSQHQWIREHHERIPVHFLIQVVDTCYLVPGHFHQLFTESITLAGLEDMALVVGLAETMTKWLPIQLRALTNRRRFNGED